MTRLYFILITLMFTGSVFSKVEIYKELSLLENQLKIKLDKEVRTFLGTRVRYGLFVFMDKKESPKKKVESYDVSYLPVPLLKHSENRPIRISEVKIRVLLYDKIDDKSINLLNTVLSNATLNLSPKISIEKMFSANPLDKSAKTDIGSREIASEKNKQSFLSKYAIYFLYFSFAVSLLLFIYFFVMSIIKSIGKAVNTSLALKYSIPKKSKEDEEKESLPPIPIESNSTVTELKEEMIKEEDKEKMEKSQAPDIIKNNSQIPQAVKAEIQIHIKRYILIFKEALQNNPYIISQALNKSDIIGLRSILPLLNEREKESLSSSLSVENCQSLIESVTGDINSLKLTDLADWLCAFSEKLTVLSIQKNNYFESILTQKTINELYTIKPNTFTDIGFKLNQSLAWMIILEFLPKEQMTEVVHSLSPEHWDSILNPKEVKEDQAEVTAKSIISMSQDKDQVLTEAQQLSNKQLKTTILDILNNNMVDDPDSFVSKLSEINQDFANKVSSEFWSLSTLQRIPLSIVGKYMEALDSTERTLFIYGAGASNREFLLNLLHESKGKTILEDSLRKLSKSTDRDYKNQSKNYTRAAINNFRMDHNKGLFQLEDEKAININKKLAG